MSIQKHLENYDDDFAQEDLEDLEDFDEDELNLHEKNRDIVMPAIQLQVKCEIGKVEISLENLSQLKFGDILELKRWPSQTVKLSVNNNYFAEGILVDVNGQFGVKITNKFNGF